MTLVITIRDMAVNVQYSWTLKHYIFPKPLDCLNQLLLQDLSENSLNFKIVFIEKFRNFIRPLKINFMTVNLVFKRFDRFHIYASKYVKILNLSLE